MLRHASAFIHTLRFGNKFRDAVGGTAYLSFTNTRGPAGSKISIPMMHKTDAGLRPFYLTHALNKKVLNLHLFYASLELKFLIQQDLLYL